MTATLRLAREEDAEALLAIYEPLVRETAISFELAPPDAEEYRSRIRAVLEGMPWLVCEEDGGVLGYAYASKFRPRPAYQWTVETTVYVHPAHHGRSVGRALYESLFGVLRLQGYRKALAIIALPNPASVALHEKLGFEPVGVFHEIGFKLHRWHDVGSWELTLQDLPSVPSTPLPLPAVSRTDAFRASLDNGARLVKPLTRL